MRGATAASVRGAWRRGAGSIGCGLAVAAALLGTASRAGADEAGGDVVVLADGTRVAGHLVAMTPGKEVVIELADHSRKTVAWADLREITLESPATALPAAAPAPKPLGGGAPAPTSGGAKATTSAATKPSDGKGKPHKKKEVSNVDLDKDNPKATYHSEEDCAESDAEDCTATTDASASKAGLSIGYKRDSVKDVTEVRHGSTNFSLSLQAIGGFGNNVYIAGGNLALSVRILTGGRFPGASGGSWFGFWFEPTISGGYDAFILHQAAQCVTVYGYTSCQPAQNMTSQAGMVLGTFGTGLQWMYFGARDPKSKKQHGFGIAAGGIAGYQQTFSSGGGQSNSSGAPLYGPQLSFVFPSYNAGTSSFSTFQVNFLVLPSKDFLFVLFGLQYAFG